MTAPETLARIERTCAELLQEGEPVTFTTVAPVAGISRTTLYRDQALRMVVEEHRTHSHRTLSGLVSEIGHLRTAVEALAERVRRHEEQLRRLELPPRRKASSR
jgi:xanthine/CO dehydrogenase XdhC/CoxF family maturation factor